MKTRQALQGAHISRADAQAAQKIYFFEYFLIEKRPWSDSATGISWSLANLVARGELVNIDQLITGESSREPGGHPE